MSPHSSVPFKSEQLKDTKNKNTKLFSWLFVRLKSWFGLETVFVVFYHQIEHHWIFLLILIFVKCFHMKDLLYAIILYFDNLNFHQRLLQDRLHWRPNCLCVYFDQKIPTINAHSSEQHWVAWAGPPGFCKFYQFELGPQ